MEEPNLRSTINIESLARSTEWHPLGAINGLEAWPTSGGATSPGAATEGVPAKSVGSIACATPLLSLRVIAFLEAAERNSLFSPLSKGGQ